MRPSSRSAGGLASRRQSEKIALRGNSQFPLRRSAGNATIPIMTLYLMRHAEAVEPGADDVTRDADRKLTDKGRRQAKRMGIMLKRLDVKIDRALASPLVRARETAELVVTAAGSKAKIKALDELKPNAKNDAMWEALCGAGGETVLVVGHLPSIASLAGSLLGSLAEQPLWFHKSSLAALHCEAREDRKPRVTLEWMISPAMAKRLAAHHSSGRSSSQQDQ
jgi:phosphohistidine phosphatase